MGLPSRLAEEMFTPITGYAFSEKINPGYLVSLKGISYKSDISFLENLGDIEEFTKEFMDQDFQFTLGVVVGVTDLELIVKLRTGDHVKISDIGDGEIVITPTVKIAERWI